MSSIIKESCIYKIENKITGGMYIGSSVCFYNRSRAHIGSLRKNNHRNRHLQNAWNKYGEQSFEISIIENCDVDLLLEREQYFINNLNPSYNITLDVIRQIPSKESVKKHSDTKKMMFSNGLLIPNGERKIYQYDLSGNFIQEFRSIVKAANDTGCNESSIHRCISGMYEQVNGFQWKSSYCGEKISTTHNKKRKCNTVLLYRLVDVNTGEEFFMNIFDMEIQFNTTRYNLYQYISKGFIFRKQYKIYKSDRKIKVGLVKLGELLENPEEDNQQPSIDLNN